MADKNETIQKSPDIAQLEKVPVSRRKFFTYAGISAATVMAVSSCTKEQREYLNPKPKDAVDLGSGDIGILNYAYALEQLEAAFYLKIVSSYYQGITEKEKTYLNAICAHEIAHREFFKNALGDKVIGAL